MIHSARSAMIVANRALWIGRYASMERRRLARALARRCALGDRSRRRRRSCPGHAGEVEEVQQVGLRSIPRRQMSGTLTGWVVVNEAILDEFDDRGVIHKIVRDVVYFGDR